MKTIAALVLTLALLVPATALASSSTCQTYSPQTCNVVTTQTGATSSGSLPFTGLDVVLLVAAGATLIGTGLVVRALTRRVN
jgi:hypothetical protein